MKNKNILVVRNLLRNLDHSALRNVEVVADRVRAFGIVKRGGNVFGDEEIFKNSSTSQAGIYQVPGQIAQALVHLSHLSISSYLEIGLFHGGNFLFVSDYLRRFNPGIRCVGVDRKLRGYLNDEIEAIVKNEPGYELCRGSSFNFRGQKFGLVFIDGDHSYRWTRADWVNVGRHADVCMFHDIEEKTTPGTGAFWRELRTGLNGKGILEYKQPEPKPPLCGIGIVHNL